MTAQQASGLTNQEQAIAREADLDLGAGYPYLSPPAWLYSALRMDSQIDRAYAAPIGDSAIDAKAINNDLLDAACALIGIDSKHALNGFATFSGSVALDRAVATVAPFGSIVSTSPAIDIIAGMVSEHPEIDVRYVNSDAFSLAIDVPGIVAASTDTTGAIIITSPENPTGSTVNSEEMRLLRDTARLRGATLIADQCFGLIDPFTIRPPLLPNLVDDDDSWMFLWDTGKTFGLNEEKLGFIFCSPNLHNAVQDRLNILQFDVSRRQKLMFTRIFRAAIEQAHTRKLSELVATNIIEAERVLASSPFRPRRPQAGSFLLLDVSDTGLTDQEVIARLLTRHGLGVIAASTFFQSGEDSMEHPLRDRYVRLAMARERDLIDTALNRLTSW